MGGLVKIRTKICNESLLQVREDAEGFMYVIRCNTRALPGGHYSCSHFTDGGFYSDFLR